MNRNKLIDLERRDENEDPLTEMLRAGAQQLIHQAVEAELQRLPDQHAFESVEQAQHLATALPKGITYPIPPTATLPTNTPCASP